MNHAHTLRAARHRQIGAGLRVAALGTMGPWMGGLAIGAGLGVAALGTVGLAALLDKRVRTNDLATQAHV